MIPDSLELPIIPGGGRIKKIILLEFFGNPINKRKKI